MSGMRMLHFSYAIRCSIKCKDGGFSGQASNLKFQTVTLDHKSSLCAPAVFAFGETAYVTGMGEEHGTSSPCDAASLSTNVSLSVLRLATTHR